MKFRFKLFKAIPWIALPFSFVALFLTLNDVPVGFVLSAISAALAVIYLFAYKNLIVDGDYDE